MLEGFLGGIVFLFFELSLKQECGKGLGVLPIMSVRNFNGVGFEANKNITIKAVHDLNFNKNAARLNATPQLFALKGKYRFNFFSLMFSDETCSSQQPNVYGQRAYRLLSL